MTALLRQAILGRLPSYEDTNDADRLRVDPAMRHVVGGRARELLGASTSEMSRFETELLACRENILALMDLCGRWTFGTDLDPVGKHVRAAHWRQDGRQGGELARNRCPVSILYVRRSAVGLHMGNIG
jgi:hypothetical protein